MNRCLYCKELTKNPKYCNHHCVGHIIGKISGKIGGKKAQIIMKRKKIGWYSKNRWVQSKAGKIGVEVNRNNKTGMYFDKKVQIKGGIRGARKNKENKTGLYDSKNRCIDGRGGKITAQRYGGWAGMHKFSKERTPKKYFENLSKFSKSSGKSGGLASIKSRRKNFPYWFKGISFDSNGEREIAMNIYYQFNIKLEERKNCHVRIGLKEYDFFVNNIFIEFHPWNMNHNSMKDYIKERRTNLNRNGYKEYPLLIIK